MNIPPPLGALVGHLVGDYILQNDWMALHKKQSSFRCAVHCAIWTLSVSVFSGWIGWPVPHWILVQAVLFASHFAQDRTQVIAWWMDRVGQKGFRTSLAPWSSIVVDNVWHIVALYAIARWLA